MKNKNTPDNAARNHKWIEDIDFLASELPKKHYWFQYISEFKTVYFKYNSCKDMIEKDLLTYGRELICFINENTVNKLVIDLKNTLGGNSQLLDEFIKAIQHCEKINRKGNLYVITGGKSNYYGEVERFKLKNLHPLGAPCWGITICYSTKYYKTIKNDRLLSFVPNINLEVSVESFIMGNDPWLEYILYR